MIFMMEAEMYGNKLANIIKHLIVDFNPAQVFAGVFVLEIE